MATKRTKYIVANAVNMVVEINETILDNAKKRQETVITLPSLFDRAFLMYHENGILPLVDTLPEEEAS